MATEEQAIDVVKALLSTIVFNRSISLRFGEDERCKHLDIYFTKIMEEKVEERINEGIKKFIPELLFQKRKSLNLHFYEE